MEKFRRQYVYRNEVGSYGENDQRNAGVYEEVDHTDRRKEGDTVKINEITQIVRITKMNRDLSLILLVFSLCNFFF